MSQGGALGSVEQALAHAGRMLAARPDLAALQAREILTVQPAEPRARALLAQALAAQGETREALQLVRALTSERPHHADLLCLQGEIEAEAGALDAAQASLTRAIRRNGRHPRAHRALGDVLMAQGDAEGADRAYGRHLEVSVRDPRLMEAAAALGDNRLAVAERLLRAFLKENPTDIAAIRMLAETGSRLGRYADAERLLARVLELAPGFEAAQYHYAIVLSRQNKNSEALEVIARLRAKAPGNAAYRALEAATHARIGEYGRTIEAYEAVLKDHPDQPKAWMSYGHALKTVGRTADGIAAYRRSLELAPSLGESWWSLANLKTFRFSDDDVAAIEAALSQTGLADEDRLHLEFALGKAQEDRGAFQSSFTHYSRGNAIRKAQLRYSAHETTEAVDRMIATYTEDFFAARRDVGSSARDAIFIIGLTRSGSTLLEQILASHSEVEGTMELPDMAAIARLAGDDPAALPFARFCELGEAYLARTQIQRKTKARLFIDKMPANWLHVGLIHTILPNARIIDARRHPLGCCFSNFKQHFARGQGFTYSLDDLGAYYRDYARLMAHMDRVLPGRIHRVFYEQTVTAPEQTVRALLDYCGLTFEEGCLRFYENDRAVRTASSEQVRQPLFSDGLDQWRHYAPWLGSLAAQLGDLLREYPY